MTTLYVCLGYFTLRGLFAWYAWRKMQLWTDPASVKVALLVPFGWITLIPELFRRERAEKRP